MTRHTSHSVVDWTQYLTHAEVDALQAMARSLPPSPHVVNIGAGNGTSGLAFMESRPDLNLYTIDIQLESSPLGCLQGEQAVFESAGFWGDPRHTQIHGDSKDVGKAWMERYNVLLDLVFVDGGHQYHECKGDIETWLPLVRPGGILVIHDFEKNHKIWHGVDQAVHELIIGKYEEVLRIDTTIAVRMPRETQSAERRTADETDPVLRSALERSDPPPSPFRGGTEGRSEASAQAADTQANRGR